MVMDMDIIICTLMIPKLIKEKNHEGFNKFRIPIPLKKPATHDN